MALKKDRTDAKGVKTRYHRIHKIEFNGDRIRVTMHSYVNADTRDSEKKQATENNKARDYTKKMQVLRDELDTLIGNPDQIERVTELSNQINELEFAPDRLTVKDTPDNHYDELEVEIEGFENVTMEGIYDRLKALPEYAGAESI